MSARVQKTIVLPINMVFRLLQSKARIQVWLFENSSMRIEGQLMGFDEYMNLVLDEAEEVYEKEGKENKKVGRIMLKGDCVSLIQQA
ncbi:small nuclear ribonucleoprotein E [Sphaeroforma arctica JP610]|uniref:Small nuclear ribonucleoprotein E n=1 Tax=Sphaeroforma arctica JP610 TaxID=667725 RepID=A0A0L0G295_9EUKA|nr:small nuclear ribonucleoprotein E [Sphaeroforma arctica JP610]KNC82959.1 small nuclear ribonucleoprotein E [Sphaeroforma arctica JP610]|eukprot:XP_014156861.1 small nuclear ribonucleoprotein E [Sphaeroforma arctica JP610]